MTTVAMPTPRADFVAFAAARSLWRVASTLLLLILALVLAALVVPRAFGFGVQTIETGSMRPTAPPGSLVLVRPVADQAVATGDVLLIRTDGAPKPVLHRVIDRRVADGRIVVRTKGDANPAADPDEYVVPRRTMVEVFAVPRLGFVTSWLFTPFGWLIGALLPATLLCGLTVVQIWEPDEEA